MAAKKQNNPALEEHISQLERTVQEAEDLAHRFHLTAGLMRRQIEMIKNGGPGEPGSKIHDWKKEVESWGRQKPSNSTAR